MNVTNKSSYKIVLSDIDGTLTNLNSEISNNTINAINYIIKNNIKFSIASGRSVDYIEKLLDRFKLKRCDIIALNGAIVYTKDKMFISRNNLDYKKLKDILKIIDNKNTFFKVYLQDYIVSGRIDYFDSFLMNFVTENMVDGNNRENLTEKFSEILLGDTIIVESLSSFLEKNRNDIFKIEIFHYNKEILNHLFAILSSLENLSVTSSYKYSIEITNKNSTKENAMIDLTKYYGIDLNDIVAIGDNHNDLGMIQLAGMGVAVENAISVLKENADFITSSNNEDGVANAIYSLIKL